MTLALVKYQHPWAIDVRSSDDALIDYLIMRHDMLESRRLQMAIYAVRVDDVQPCALCVCGCQAEHHEVLTDLLSAPFTDAYYDECTTQGCDCKLFKEAE